MLEDLKTSVEVILKALNLRSESVRRRRNKKLLRDLLTAYYCFVYIVRHGEDLLSLAGEDPINQVMALPEEERLKFASRVYALLLTQRLLLGELANIVLYGEPFLEILDPELKSEIEGLANSKEKGLLAVGAALEMYFFFGAVPSQEEVQTHGKELAKIRYQAGLISLIFSQNYRKTINSELAKKNLKGLKNVNERLLSNINEVFPLEDRLELAKEAEERVKSIIRS